MDYVIDAANPTGRQILNAPECGKGACVTIANKSATDTLFWASDQTALQASKQSGQNSYGTPLNAGSTIVIPWVTTALYAINYGPIGTPTPGDVIATESWV